MGLQKTQTRLRDQTTAESSYSAAIACCVETCFWNDLQHSSPFFLSVSFIYITSHCKTQYYTNTPCFPMCTKLSDYVRPLPPSSLSSNKVTAGRTPPPFPDSLLRLPPCRLLQTSQCDLKPRTDVTAHCLTFLQYSAHCLPKTQSSGHIPVFIQYDSNLSAFLHPAIATLV